jgi:hypothetical protein
MNLDYNQKSTYVATPYDDEILEWKKKANDTYVYYGCKDQDKKSVQISIDERVEEVSTQANVKRSVVKSSVNYRNSSWDLVDAMDDKEAKKEIFKEENLATLPDSMRHKSNEEMTAFAKAKKQQRIAI